MTSQVNLLCSSLEETVPLSSILLPPITPRHKKVFYFLNIYLKQSIMQLSKQFSELVPGVWKIFKFQWTLTFLSCHQLLCKGFRYNQQRIGHSRSLNVIIYFRFSGILFLKFMNKALPRSNTLSEAFCIKIKCSIIIITLCMSADWYSSVIYGHVLAQIPLFWENDVFNSWHCFLWYVPFIVNM